MRAKGAPKLGDKMGKEGNISKYYLVGKWEYYFYPVGKWVGRGILLLPSGKI